jgi:hypothetical protein
MHHEINWINFIFRLTLMNYCCHYCSLWAPYWYDKAHQSTGFSSFQSGGAGGGAGSGKRRSASYRLQSPHILTDAEKALYREAVPFYEFLRNRAIGIDLLCPDSSTRFSLHVSQEVPMFANDFSHSAVELLADSRNKDILVWIGDRLLPRECAKVSVFDSSVQGGDACWEGMRLYNHSVFKLEEHIARLIDSAKALAFENIPSSDFIRQAFFRTIAANGMSDGVHVRMTLSRGMKLTSSMNPKFNVFGCNLIILPEYKAVGDMTTYDNRKGIVLITASNRRNAPQCVDSKIHHNNLINNSKCYARIPTLFNVL